MWTIDELVNMARLHDRRFKLQFNTEIKTVKDLLEFVALYKKRYNHFNKPVQKAVRNWIDSCPPFKLEREFINTEKHNGWSLRDVFRMFHPVPVANRDFLYRYIVGKWKKGEPINSEFKLIKRRIENGK